MPTYTTDDREDDRFHTVAQLSEAKYYYEPSPDPTRTCVPIGEWYCKNSDCRVREVRVRWKLDPEGELDLPETLKCPACSELLKFNHYLKETILLKVEDSRIRSGKPMHDRYYKP